MLTIDLRGSDSDSENFQHETNERLDKLIASRVEYFLDKHINNMCGIDSTNLDTNTLDRETSYVKSPWRFMMTDHIDEVIMKLLEK